MTYNRITAEIGESRRITTRPISYQYDTVQILMLTEADGVELPSYFQVDFCVIGDTDTVTIVGSLTGGAPIPDSLLQQGENLMAYLVLTGSESDVQTRYEITIPVNERPTRSGIEMTSEQQAQVDSLVAALNDGVTRSETAADEAEAASQAVQDMGVEAETLPEGSAATVEKTVDPETGVVTLTYGIPKGKKGAKGDKGNTGETYMLAPSVDTIVKNPNTGTFIPAQIIFTVYKVVNGTSSPYRAAAIVANIFGSGMVPHYEVINDYSLTVPINSIADTGYVACTAYGNGGIIATITIPCILDGAKGDPGEGVAPGGTTGQFLKKKTGTDYDTEWADVDPGVTSVNGKTGAVTLTASDVGAKPASYEAPVSSVNGKTGAVVLDAGDIGYDGETTYPSGSAGAALSEINSALSSLSAVTEIIDTASGAIASFPDGAGLPMRSLLAQINPVQDLHGYDAPWAAGAGLNKLPKANLDDISNLGSMTVTIADDGSITLNGTPTSNATVTVPFDSPLPAGSYTWFYFNPSVSENVSLSLRTSSKALLSGSFQRFSIENVVQPITIAEDAYYWRFQVNANTTLTNFMFKPMLCVGAVESATYQPYANECPISGWSGLSGKRCGKNLLPQFNSPQTYSNVTGTLTEDGAIELSGTSNNIVYMILDSDLDTEKFAGCILNSEVIANPNNVDVTKFGLRISSQSDFVQLQNCAINTDNTLDNNGKNRRLSLRFATGGVDLTGVKIRAMLRKADSDATFEPSTSLPIACSWVGVIGKNMLDMSSPYRPDSLVATDGTISTNSNFDTWYFSQVGEFTTSMTVTEANNNGRIIIMNADGTKDTSVTLPSTIGRGSVTFTLADGQIAYISIRKSATDCQIEAGSTATSYEPYKNIVYGANIDIVTGVLTVTDAIYNPTGNEANYIQQTGRVVFAVPREYRGGDTIDRLCSDFGMAAGGTYCYVNTSMTVEELKTYFQSHTVQMLLPLTDRLTYQLTPQQISTLLGNNTVFVDTGSVSVTYQASIKGYIDKVLAS